MSVPQTAPEIGEPSPLQRKVSGHDDKVTNLMQRFPGVPEDAIRQELRNAAGHASKARNAIQKKYCAVASPATPGASPNTTPMPLSKEPTAPTSPVGQAPKPRDLAPPRSAPALMEQPRRAAKQSEPTGEAAAKVDNLKSRFPDQDHDAVKGALKQAGGHAGKAATILSKGSAADGGKAAPGGKADTGKVDVFLASLSRSELKKVAADAEKALGVAPSATRNGAAAEPKERSVKKSQNASCFKMLGHICASDGPKGLRAQSRADSFGA